MNSLPSHGRARRNGVRESDVFSISVELPYIVLAVVGATHASPLRYHLVNIVYSTSKRNSGNITLSKIWVSRPSARGALTPFSDRKARNRIAPRERLWRIPKIQKTLVFMM
jgi:hypothetical protein